MRESRPIARLFRIVSIVEGEARNLSTKWVSLGMVLQANTRLS